MAETIVIALGGNAIKQADQEGTAEEQFENVRSTCKEILEVIKRGYKVVVTHGNGPQAGNLLIQQEEGVKRVPSQPLDIVGAMTQGQIGYMIQQTLNNYLKRASGELAELPVVTVVNHVLVDKDDPEFKDENATKPVGPFYAKEKAMQLREEKGYLVKKVKPSGDKTWRRVVPSPDPIRNIEGKAIKNMVEAGIIVIASGGGGIPVIEEDGELEGVEAIIDKDLAGERLAEVVNADVFLILTDIEKVKLNFGKPNEEDIDRMTLKEAKKYLEEGHFLSGSMGPKVKACIRFLEARGGKAVITSLGKTIDALDGKTGTIIVG